MAAERKPGTRVCSITDALSLVGDRYALLIVRELRYGNNRFQEIASNLGAPRDVLTARLRKLEAGGVIERVQYQERPPRFEYVMTDAGRELQPILLALKEWGDRHLNEGEEPIVFEHTCGAEFHAVTTCAACGEAVEDGSLTVVGGTHPVNATM